jgi:hypothetical protein
MPDFIPDPEFEKKLQAAASSPLADPALVKRLRGRIVPGPQTAGPQTAVLSTAAKQPAHKGQLPMRNRTFPRTRILLPALAVFILLVLGAFFLFNPVTPVSAQQILERSAAVQSSAKPSSGIWHLRMELVDNPSASGQSAMKTIEDQYFDLSTGLDRMITTNAAGDVVDISANDGAFTYSAKRSVDGAVITPLSVVRSPMTQIQAGKQVIYDPALVSKSIFDQFNDNPRVKVAGKVSRPDGSQAYVLVLPNTQTQKTSGGQVEQTITGETRAVFNASTYQFLEYQTTVRKDGKDILINSVSFLTNEILPAGTQVAWNLSDLKGITVTDEQPAEQTDNPPQVKIVSEHELAAVAHGYVLKNPPAGYELKIVMIPGPTPGSEPQNYEINYASAGKDTLMMQWVGKLEPGFVEANFYDGSYKAASGLELHYTPSNHDEQTGGTAAMLVTPDGTGFLVGSTLLREQVQNLVEDLVPIQ